MDVPELPPMQLYEQIPTMQTFTPSLTTYDEFIEKGGSWQCWIMKSPNVANSCV
jgi:hypothetical protein